MMTYNGKSNGVAAVVAITNGFVKIANTAIICGVVLTFWYGPRVLPWYKY